MISQSVGQFSIRHACKMQNWWFCSVISLPSLPFWTSSRVQTRSPDHYSNDAWNETRIWHKSRKFLPHRIPCIASDRHLHFPCRTNFWTRRYATERPVDRTTIMFGIGWWRRGLNEAEQKGDPDCLSSLLIWSKNHAKKTARLTDWLTGWSGCCPVSIGKVIIMYSSPPPVNRQLYSQSVHESIPADASGDLFIK